MFKFLNWKHLLPLCILFLIGVLPFLEFLFSGDSLYSSDQISSPAWKFYFDSLRLGEFPLWNPYVLGGMPTIDAMFGDSTYPLFLLLGFVFPVETVVGYNFVLHVLIAGFTAYFLAYRYFGVGRWVALALSVCYMLNTNFISLIYSGHTGKFFIIAWFPLALFFLLRSLSDKYKWYHLLGLSLSVALFVITSHLQFTYYVLMGFFLVYIYQFVIYIKKHIWKKVGSITLRFWIPILLGVGLTFPMFYPPIKYNTEFSVRGTAEKQTYEHATSWSINFEEFASFVVPEFTGLNENYWGHNYFKLNSEYPGLVILLLGLMGLWLYRKSWMWFWFGVSLVVVTFALGANTPIFKLYYNFIPGIKNFRAPSMILFWFVASFFMLSGWTIRSLFIKNKNKVDTIPSEVFLKRVAKLQVIGYGFSGFLFLCAFAPEIFYGIWNSIFTVEVAQNFARQSENYDNFRMGSIRSAIICALITWGIITWGIRKPQKNKFAFLILIIATIDFLLINHNFIKIYDHTQYFPKEPIVESILKKDTSEYRVFGLPRAYTRGYMQYNGIEDVGGFADNENRFFREYRGEPYNANPNLMDGLKQKSDGTVSGSTFLDLLNVKYILVRDPRTGQLQYAMNTSFLPRVSFYTNWEIVEGAEALDKMKNSEFNSKGVLYVQKPNNMNFVSTNDTTEIFFSSIRKNSTPNKKVYEVSNNKPGIMMLSDIYFPHWNVEVNGKKQELLRVNHLFRGVFLESGKHSVTFQYRSPWIRVGWYVSISSLVLLIIFLVITGFRRRKVDEI